MLGPTSEDEGTYGGWRVAFFFAPQKRGERVEGFVEEDISFADYIILKMCCCFHACLVSCGFSCVFFSVFFLPLGWLFYSESLRNFDSEMEDIYMMLEVITQ